MILIIGAGLSGLLTAYRLKQAGIPFKILEARPRLGGRINTIKGSSGIPVEMGATWFNEGHQNLIQLLNELQLNDFEQYMKGTVFYQPHSNASVQALELPPQPPSYRISGGSSHLVAVLYAKLDPEDVLLNQPVTHISFEEKGVKVIAQDTFEGTQLVLALPPKLWAKKISFEPNVPQNLLDIGKETHTWMEDSIKIALTYKNPFWNEAKQAGTLFSTSGPMTEVYDHCNMERSTYALCGFMSTSYKGLQAEQRKQNVINQLQHVFGAKAAEFLEYHECIWSQEECTFTPDATLLFPHQNNGNPVFRETYFNNRLLISSSESAKEFAGYMDGAISAGNLTAEKIIKAKQNAY